MQNFGGQFKRGIKTVATMAASGAVFALLQATAIGVSATILPVLVSVNHLDFGTVFPGERLNREFTVTLAPENQSQSLTYWIEQKRKPLPPSHPEFPSGGDPALPGFYRDLCPFLTKTPEAGEGDAEVQASLTASTDPVDRWQVDLNVPAISSPIDGGVAQDHNGGVVSTNGEYGCDIGINVNPVCGNGIQEPGEECDLGSQNGLPGSHCSTQCKTVQDCTTPVDVVLVFDRSGSMKFDNGQRLIDAKAASKGFLDLLGTSDHASLVSYSSSVTVNQTLSTDFALIKTKIDALTASGSTNIGDAIKAANLELASSRARTDAIHVEVLLTDGLANKPFGSGTGENPADVAYAISRANEAAAAGYKIFTIGLGSDINAAMLQQIATSTGGQFFASPSSSDLAAIYAQISRALCPEVPRCGDGVKNQTSEECDDGNDSNEDACLNNCKLPGIGGPETFCGDGVRQTPNDSGFDEQCDDQNQVNGDGCETDCTITTFCGDGHIQAPNDSFQIEACDNGPSNGVACTAAYGSQCTYCSTLCEPITVRGPFCGDQITNGTEQCDDGNTVDTDTCRNNCTAFVAPFCGDNTVNQSSEECDEGADNGQPGSQCSASCLRTACSQPADVVLVFDRSGSMNFDNGARLADAQAAAKGFLDLLAPTDRAALVVYSSFTQTAQTLTANFAGIKTKIDAITATGATNIGDAIKAANLELTSVRARTGAAHVEILLTDGKANKPNGTGFGEDPRDVQYALDRATLAAAAGIKIFTIGLGSDINATMLQQIAAITGGQYFASPSSTDLAAIYAQIAGDLCPDARCGDNVVNQATEQCDAGPVNGSACTAEYGLSCTYCSATCQNTRVVGPFCGDSQVNGTEACDDGNTNDGDACRNDCTSPPLGLAAPPLCLGDHCGEQSGPNSPFLFCGDGQINQTAEQCDNASDNGRICTPMYGAQCAYCSDTCQHVVVAGPFCGDKLINGPEACDDGNGVDTDGCRNDCTANADVTSSGFFEPAGNGGQAGGQSADLPPGNPASVSPDHDGEGQAPVHYSGGIGGGSSLPLGRRTAQANAGSGGGSYGRGSQAAVPSFGETGNQRTPDAGTAPQNAATGETGAAVEPSENGPDTQPGFILGAATTPPGRGLPQPTASTTAAANVSPKQAAGSTCRTLVSVLLVVVLSAALVGMVLVRSVVWTSVLIPVIVALWWWYIRCV